MGAMEDFTPKIRVNLTVGGKLLDEARARKINLSRAAEEGILKAINEEKASRWLAENEPLLAARRAWVEKNGTFGDRVRAWKTKHGAV